MKQDALNLILDKLGSIEKDINEVKSEVKTLKSKFDVFEAKQSSFENKIKTLKSKFEGFEAKQSSFENDITDLKSKFDIFQLNQQKLLELWRETRLEYDTRDRIARERHEEIMNHFSILEADIEHAIEKSNRNERELARVKKQLEAM